MIAVSVHARTANFSQVFLVFTKYAGSLFNRPVHIELTESLATDLRDQLNTVLALLAAGAGGSGGAA